MISSIVRVKDKYVDSNNVSLQPEHLNLYINGKLISIVLADTNDNIIAEFKGPALTQLMASAIANGKRTVETYRGTEHYYLGNRS